MNWEHRKGGNIADLHIPPDNPNYPVLAYFDSIREALSFIEELDAVSALGVKVAPGSVRLTFKSSGREYIFDILLP